MDRSGAVGWADRFGVRRAPGDGFVLPSRRAAADALRAALDAQAGPALVTGEPGVGKTWLCRHLRGTLPAQWRWLILDLSPAVGPDDLYQLLLHGMGLAPAGGLAEARGAMADALEAAAADGQRLGLIVEECHAAGPAVLEELRVVTNRLGEPDALAGVVFTGQTSLLRRLATRSLAAFGARIATGVHLRPFTVEEAGAWLAEFDPAREWGDSDVERLHRATGGNPLRIASASNPPRDRKRNLDAPEPRRSREPVSTASTQPVPGFPTDGRAAHASTVPLLPPGKPPLEVGDGMIEVGWDANPEPQEDAEGPSVASGPAGPPTSSASTEEAVNDHYAALQAWSEWAQNQGREPVAAVGPVRDGDESDDDARMSDDEDVGQTFPGNPALRAEGQHAFAPYSQLFSRLRQSHES